MTCILHHRIWFAVSIMDLSVCSYVFKQQN